VAKATTNIGNQATQHDEVAQMQILSLNQAAYRAGIVRRTLERLLAEGTGPAKVQLSKRRVGILESDLDRWLTSRRVPKPEAQST
jgi:predicted DNA-binding transcriptional regulator AlpA